MSSFWVAQFELIFSFFSVMVRLNERRGTFMKIIQKLSAMLAVAALIAALAVPVQAAGWETGIKVDTSTPAAPSAEQKAETFDTPEKFAAEVLRLVNVERANKELDPLVQDEKLAKIAAVRATESATRFAHLRPDGRAVSTAFSDAELSYSAAGENLSRGYATPAALMTAWMASETHKKNILKAEFKSAELGYFKNSTGVVYAALVFFAPQEG
jgi:uncharacterized protein YkwD